MMMKLKNSKQREAILNILNRERNHPTVDEIYSLVRGKFPRISLATVYRNLEQLCRFGKIEKIECAGQPARFDCVTIKHYHIECRSCGKVEDIFLKKKLEDCINLQTLAQDFTVTGYKIDFYGLCPDCKNNGSQSTPAGEK